MSTSVASAVHNGQQLALTIEKLTHGGAGLAFVDGLPVFVPGATPGQQVEVVITKQRGSYAEAKLQRVVRRAIDDVPPRCQHVHDCGGCSWQHLPYDKQLTHKEDIVRETLGHLTPVDEDLRRQLPGRVLKIIPSPQVFHYRNKLELSFGYATMRTEERAGKRIYLDQDPSIGFHRPSDWATVLPISECHLYDEQSASLIADVKRFLQETRLPVYNPKTHKGFLRTLLLRRGVHTGEHMLCFLVNARKKELEPLFQHFMRFAGRPGLKSLLVVEHTGMSDKPEQPQVHALLGKQTITERLFDLTFEISPFSFFQTNTLGAEKLYQAIARGADLQRTDTVLDAYCGMGTIGQYLARSCEKVVGIESHPAAIQDALTSSGRNRIANISFYKGRAEQVLRDQLQPGGKYHFDVIVVDPPRAGLHPKALDALIAHAPRTLVYVSCNTATLARDMGGLLKAGYELRTVQPVDMFPHTPHIETVSVLERKG